MNSDSHLKTDHLLGNLKHRTISSGVVTGVQQVTMFLISLASVVVLARLLDPADFGLLAMVFAVTGVFRAFSDAGLSTATIQREHISHAQVSNLFWTNAVLGLTIALVLALLSPAVAWFYREPRVGPLTVAVGASFVLTGLGVQHIALLRRQMRFGAIAVIQVFSAGLGLLVGAWMAWSGFGYWSLVGIQITTPATALLLSWTLCRWRPQFPSRGSGTRPLLGFGANLTASDFLWSLARSADGLFIGRWIGAEALGVYSRATALLNRPLEQASVPLGAVFLPVFSRVQHDPERYRRAVLEVHELIALISLPCAAVVLTLAEPMTLVVLGQKWRDAAPVLAAYSLYAMYVPVILTSGWALSSQGRGRDFLLLSCFNSTTTVLAFAAGTAFGYVGVAMSFSLSCLLVQLPVTYAIVGRSGVIRTRELWQGVLRHLPLWAIVAATTWFVRSSVAAQSPVVQLMAALPAGAAAASVGIWLLPHSRRSAAGAIAVGHGWWKGRLAASEQHG